MLQTKCTIRLAHGWREDTWKDSTVEDAGRLIYEKLVLRYKAETVPGLRHLYDVTTLGDTVLLRVGGTLSELGEAYNEARKLVRVTGSERPGSFREWALTRIDIAECGEKGV